MKILYYETFDKKAKRAIAWKNFKEKCEEIGKKAWNYKEQIIAIGTVSYAAIKKGVKIVNAINEKYYNDTHYYDHGANMIIRHGKMNKKQQAEFLRLTKEEGMKQYDAYKKLGLL